MRVELGNPAAKEAYRDVEIEVSGQVGTYKGELKHRDLDGNRVTTVVIPDSYTLLEAVAAVLAQDGAWNNHTRGNRVGDVTPDWVESDNEALAQLLSEQMGCKVGRPKTWKAVA